MRLDHACFVLAKPKVPTMPTRRAFLIAGGMFVGGVSLGGACGYSAGHAAGEEAERGKGLAAPAGEIKLEPSGDVELDALRRLAVQAPIDDLFERGPLFIGLRMSPYTTDEILWKGIERMTLEVVNNPARRVDPVIVGLLIGSIEGPGHLDCPSLSGYLPALRRRKLAEQRRK